MGIGVYPPAAPARLVGKANTALYPTPLGGAVTPGVSGSYSAYIELISAAGNSFNRYITGITLQATAGFAGPNISGLLVRFGIGDGGAEVPTDYIPLAWTLHYEGSSVGWPGAVKTLAIPLTFSSGTRIAASVTHLGSTYLGACRLSVEHAPITSVEGS